MRGIEGVKKSPEAILARTIHHARVRAPKILIAPHTCLRSPSYGKVTSPAQLRAEREATDDAECRGYGAMPGTPVYVQCRVGLNQARAS